MKLTHLTALLLALTSSTVAKKVAKRDLQQKNGAGAGTKTTSTSHSTSTKEWSSEYGVLQFENLGFEGNYYKVKSIDSSSDDACTCELNQDEPYSFSGTNAPLNEELSVHVRGPANLQKFAFFVKDDYSVGDTDGNWTRLAYYDSESKSAENVTFLANVGKNVTCLGKALDYVDSDGVSQAKEATVLDNVTIVSNEEFIIMSNVSCEKSDWDNDCGVYRDGIPAFHGYDGTTKMFLFQFLAPTENTVDEDTASYNMPAIWLLNANIPRTAQYPLNGNCSSWNSGGGEFDIFEVMNDTESNHFFSTIHDFQGTGYIETGLQNFGHLDRTPDALMLGGVVFSSDGKATVFLSNDTTFDDNLPAEDLSKWISSIESADEENVMSLATVTVASSTSTASTTTKSKGKNGAAAVVASDGLSWKVFTLLAGLLSFV